MARLCAALHSQVKGRQSHKRRMSFCLELHGSLNRCLSYKVSFPWLLITNADINTEGVWRRIFISKEEYANVKCAEVYILSNSHSPDIYS